MNNSNGIEIKNRIKMREILYNLEIKKDVMNSLIEFKKLKNNDDNLIILVLQKIHNILYDSYDIEYIKILLDIIITERTIDELFKIFFDFEDRKDFIEIIMGFKNEVILFKYLRKLKNNHLLHEFIEEIEGRYYKILNDIE